MSATLTEPYSQRASRRLELLNPWRAELFAETQAFRSALISVTVQVIVWTAGSVLKALASHALGPEFT